MPSFALRRWTGERSAALDGIESAHRALSGSGPGQRIATQQVNQAYAVLLSAHFQGFCRELHTECADYIVGTVADLGLRSLFRLSLLQNRKLDRGNANSGNLGSDFGRYNLVFWALVDPHRVQNPQRRVSLDELNDWRNAIAHQDFTPAMRRSGRTSLQLAQVQTWRKACDGLAQSFDDVMRAHIQTATGTVPW